MEAGDKPVERRMERHYYQMPESCELFLAAVCAIQDYWKWLAKRGVDVQATIHSENPALDFLIPAISPDAITVRSAQGFSVADFDQSIAFDGEVAYKLSLATEKHITQVFGMLVGSDPPKVVPDLSAVPACNKAAVNDILLLPFSGAGEVAEFLGNNYPDVTTVMLDEAEVECYERVFECRMVVGMRSGLTYLAASTGRAVLELYPSDQHRNWLSKWSAGLYQMIYGDPAGFSSALVYRAVEHLWQRAAQRQRAMAVVASAK